MKVVNKLKEKEDANYAHKNDNVIEACGLTEERIEDIQSLVFEFVKESKTLSEICEKIEKALTKRELAFIVTQQATEHIKEASAMASLRFLFDTLDVSSCKKE